MYSCCSTERFTTSAAAKRSRPALTVLHKASHDDHAQLLPNLPLWDQERRFAPLADRPASRSAPAAGGGFLAGPHPADSLPLLPRSQRKRMRSAVQTKTCPRRAGRSPEWPATSAGGRLWPGVDRVWHPVDLPQGYHTAPRGQSYASSSPVTSRAAPGAPRGRATPGRRDATRAPACKIIRGRRAAEGITTLGAAVVETVVRTLWPAVEQAGRGGTPWTIGPGQVGRRRMRCEAWDGFHSPHNPEVVGSNPTPATTERPLNSRFRGLSHCVASL